MMVCSDSCSSAAMWAQEAEAKLNPVVSCHEIWCEPKDAIQIYCYYGDYRLNG